MIGDDVWKDAVETRFDEDIAVVLDDELRTGCVDIVTDGVPDADGELDAEATVLTWGVCTDVIEVADGLVVQEESFRYSLTASAYGVPLTGLPSEAVAS